MKEKINRELEQYLDREISKEKDRFIRYSYSLLKDYTAGGKRLRPIACILSFDANNGIGRIMPVALAMELYHNYTLILDDIMDEDELRRGKPSVFKKMKDHYLVNFKEKKSDLFDSKSSRFGVSFAILLGISVRSLAEKLILESDFHNILKISAMKKLEELDLMISRGQMMDIYMEETPADEQEYMKMIHLKTAVLFGLCFELGALFAGKDENTQHTMKTIGEKIALSFQINDDVLDLTDKKGHSKGSDIKKGKNTLLMIKLKEKKTLKKQPVENIIEMMHDTGAVDYCRKLSASLTDDAKELVKNLNVSGYFKSQIIGFAELMNNPA